MDTLETDEPVGGEGATSSQDTSEVETQPVETPDAVSAPEGAEAEQTETLLAGKYKSPEELEKAYSELEGKLGSLGQKAAVADLLQEKYGMTPDKIRETIEAQERARMEQQYQENPGAYAVQQVNELKAQLALRDEEKEIDSFLNTPEGEPYRANKEEIMEAAFHMPRYKDKTYGEIATSLYGKTRAQGQQDAYKKIDAKQRTQATGTKSAPAKKFTEADYANMSAAELAAVLPHADTSSRPY